MQNTSIWNKILFIDSLILVMTGALFAMLPFLVTDFGTMLYSFSYNGATINLTSEALQYTNFLIALSGAVMLGWGSMSAYLSYKLLQEDSETIWNAFTIGVVVWFLEDSSVSVLGGAIFNVVLNLGFLIMFMVPIIGRKLSN